MLRHAMLCYAMTIYVCSRGGPVPIRPTDRSTHGPPPASSRNCLQMHVTLPSLGPSCRKAFPLMLGGWGRGERFLPLLFLFENHGMYEHGVSVIRSRQGKCAKYVCISVGKSSRGARGVAELPKFINVAITITTVCSVLRGEGE